MNRNMNQQYNWVESLECNNNAYLYMIISCLIDTNIICLLVEIFYEY